MTAPVAIGRRAAAAALLGALLAAGCASPGPGPASPPPRGLGPSEAGAVLARFAAALQAGRFAEAHALLSVRWREAYTPGRLAVDFAGAGAGAQEAVERVARAVAGGPGPRVEQGRAVLALGAGRAAVLLAEPDGWRVDRIE